MKTPDQPNNAITAIGLTIPKRDSLTVGEYLELEKLGQQNLTPLEYDLHTIAVLYNARKPDSAQAVDPQDLLDRPLAIGELEEITRATDELRIPFAEGIQAQRRARALSRARELSKEELDKAVKMAEEHLKELKAIRKQARTGA